MTQVSSDPQSAICSRVNDRKLKVVLAESATRNEPRGGGEIVEAAGTEGPKAHIH